MRILFSVHRQELKIIHSNSNWTCEASSIVRNELNGWRPNIKKIPSAEVVHMITIDNIESNIPVMPRHFPIGLWNVTGVQYRNDKWRAPLIITTDAYQVLDQWDLKANGGYANITNYKVNDYQYHLHFSQSNTTQGCIKIHTLIDVYRLAAESLMALANKEKVLLEVIS